MTVGLVGAQRVGKSTLAEAFSKKEGIPALFTTTAEVFKKFGFDPKVDYSLATRLDLQRHILENIEQQYRSMGLSAAFITDRTPVDLMAYTLADVQRSNVPSELEGVIEAYMNDCIEVANMYFSTMLLVQPGIKPIEHGDKAPATFAYTEHINALCSGLLIGDKIEAAHYRIPRDMLDLDRRVEAVKLAVERTFKRFKDEMKELEEAGELVIH